MTQKNKPVRFQLKHHRSKCILDFDKATNPIRDDIAAQYLQGKIDAPKFVSPETMQIKCDYSYLKSAPDNSSPNVSEVFFGEMIDVYEVKNGFAWVQLKRDNYVGYLEDSSIAIDNIETNMKVKALRTFAFSIPKVQGEILHILPMNAMVRATDKIENGYVYCEDLGYIYQNHLCATNEFYSDPIEIAKWFYQTPYAWGGRQALGIDCSGLIQTIFEACGTNLPRDARMQEKIGELIEPAADFSNLKPCDLLFWQGHVAMMIDETNIIHANSFHMCVEIEPLTQTIARYEGLGLKLRTVRRLK